MLTQWAHNFDSSVTLLQMLFIFLSPNTSSTLKATRDGCELSSATVAGTIHPLHSSEITGIT